jgi:hypothetical protein
MGLFEQPARQARRDLLLIDGWKNLSWLNRLVSEEADNGIDA